MKRTQTPLQQPIHLKITQWSPTGLDCYEKCLGSGIKEDLSLNDVECRKELQSWSRNVTPWSIGISGSTPNQFRFLSGNTSSLKEKWLPASFPGFQCGSSSPFKMTDWDRFCPPGLPGRISREFLPYKLNKVRVASACCPPPARWHSCSNPG